MPTPSASLSLTDRLTQLASEHDEVNAAIRAILLDVEFVNGDNPDFQSILRRRAKLEVQIWTLKSNWQ